MTSNNKQSMKMFMAMRPSREYQNFQEPVGL